MLRKVQIIQTGLLLNLQYSRDVNTDMMQTSAHDVIDSVTSAKYLLLNLSLDYDEHSSLMNIVPCLIWFQVL